MSEYPWNEKNHTFTWLSSLYNPFNAADAHKSIKDFCVIQVELLGMKFVKKESYQVAISEKKKACENLKGVIGTRYSDFDESVFSEYEIIWVTNLGARATRSMANNKFLQAF